MIAIFKKSIFFVLLCQLCSLSALDGYLSFEAYAHKNAGYFEKKIKFKKPKKVNKPLCLLYGNCQTSFVYEYLKKNFPDKYDYVLITNFILIWENGQFPMEQAQKADLFIYQPLYGHGELDTNYIKTQLKPSCSLLSIPYIYFLGYFPDFFDDPNNAKTVGSDMLFGMFPYGSKRIKDLVEEGYTATQIIEKSYEDDFISKEQIFEKLHSSINMLREREQETDVKLSNFIEKKFRKHKLFFSTNHATNFLLKELIRQVLTKINLPTKKINQNPFFDREFFATWTSGIIYPCVAKTLDLQFDTSLVILKKEMVFYPFYISEYIRWLYPDK